MKIDGSPSVAPGQQQNVPAPSTTQPSQKVKPGHWASPAGSSALTHEATNPRKRARTLIREVTAERDRGALREKLADTFRKADPDVREAMRATIRYHNIVQGWAKDLVRDAWNGPRTTIHRGDQAMRELHRVATGLPPELAADLVVAAAPEFVDYSKYTVRHDKDNPAIFSSNDRVLVSIPSPEPNPDVEASKPAPDAEPSKPNPDDEASKPSPNDEVSQSSPDPKASMPKYENYTYFGSLKAWIGRAEIPNRQQDKAISDLERLVDKS